MKLNKKPLRFIKNYFGIMIMMILGSLVFTGLCTFLALYYQGTETDFYIGFIVIDLFILLIIILHPLNFKDEAFYQLSRHRLQLLKTILVFNFANHDNTDAYFKLMRQYIKKRQQILNKSIVNIVILQWFICLLCVLSPDVIKLADWAILQSVIIALVIWMIGKVISAGIKNSKEINAQVYKSLNDIKTKVLSLDKFVTHNITNNLKYHFQSLPAFAAEYWAKLTTYEIEKEINKWYWHFRQCEIKDFLIPYNLIELLIKNDYLSSKVVIDYWAFYKLLNSINYLNNNIENNYEKDYPRLIEECNKLSSLIRWNTRLEKKLANFLETCFMTWDKKFYYSFSDNNKMVYKDYRSYLGHNYNNYFQLNYYFYLFNDQNL